MITIVSGLPRSGTSLMMQMLVAGGLSPVTDDLRKQDIDNPRGYYEWSKVKDLPRQPGLIAEAEGKAVKIISSLLASVEPAFEYRIVLMCRPLNEVIASQNEMIARRGEKGASISEAGLMRALDALVKQVNSWLKSRPDMSVQAIQYHNLLNEPPGQAEQIQRFIGVPLDVAAMARAVDPQLYRHREGR